MPAEVGELVAGDGDDLHDHQAKADDVQRAGEAREGPRVLAQSPSTDSASTP